MGTFRFLLAALVVLFHFGGLSWIVGRVAVFAFYCISGFLIFQVLDRVYFEERGATPRFLLNRLLRIGPLYVTYVALTAALIAWAGRDALITDQGRPVLPEGELGDLFVASLTFKRIVGMDGGVPLLYFDAPLLPQGWSIGIEATFYLLAPLVVFTTRSRPWLLAVWMTAGVAVFVAALRAAGVDFDRFQVLVYKNAAASWFVFFAGGAMYYVRRRWGQPLPLALPLVLLGVWLDYARRRCSRDVDEASAAAKPRHRGGQSVVWGLPEPLPDCCARGPCLRGAVRAAARHDDVRVARTGGVRRWSVGHVPDCRTAIRSCA
jgi:peptidoglycan/LPS O-acetylase OafA/YrhL